MSIKTILTTIILLSTLNAQNHRYSDEEYLNEINQDEYIEDREFINRDKRVNQQRHNNKTYKFSDEHRLEDINGGSFDKPIDNRFINTKVIDIPYGSKIKAVVNISSQRLSLYANEKLVYKWKVSTGRYKFATPRGSYRPYSLQKMHYSKKYDNAPMPHSVFFRGGYAIHGTTSIRRLGKKASHGCIRLHPKNAKIFYDVIQKQGKRRVSIIVK